MKTAAKITFALALSGLSFGSYAFAQTAMTDDMLSIVDVGELTNASTDTSSIPATYRNPSPDTIAKAQEDIRNDPALMAMLQAKNVELENVIGVQTAANGGKIVYVH